MVDFSDIYFPVTIATMVVLLICSLKMLQDKLSPLLGVVASSLYLMGMFRSKGIDIVNYKYAYSNIDKTSIYDPGFNLLIRAANYLNFDFEYFLLAIGCLNLLLLIKIAKHFQIKYGILVSILILHIFVVRDFSQMRVGIAVNLVLFGFTLKGFYRYLFYLAGASMHFTSLALVGLIFSYSYYSNKRGPLKLLPFLAIFALGASLSALSFIDPRIELYLNWQRPDYGEKVTNFLQLGFIVYLIFCSQLFNILRMDLFLFSFIFALAVFLSFSSTAIFSHRLTNIALSFYPIFVAQKINFPLSGRKKLFLVTSLLVLLMSRSTTSAIINAIKIGI